MALEIVGPGDDRASQAVLIESPLMGLQPPPLPSGVAVARDADQFLFGKSQVHIASKTKPARSGLNQ